MKLHKKKILVTGGAGFIGSNLVHALAGLENQVVVLDDFSSGKMSNLEKTLAQFKNVEVISGSILDQALISTLIPKVDLIFHLAVKCLRLSFEHPHIVHDTNATGTLLLLETVKKISSEKKIPFIYVSSSEIYGTASHPPMTEDHPKNPKTVYATSKLAGEYYTLNYHQTFDLPVTVVRPFNTYGPNEHLEGFSGEVIPRFSFNLLQNKAPVIFGNGLQTRDFTFVEDTVKGLIAIAEAPSLNGEIVNLAYGQEVSILEISQILRELLNKQQIEPVFNEARPADVLRHWANVDKLWKHTKFRPQIDIRTGISLYLKWFQAQGMKPNLASQDTKNW